MNTRARLLIVLVGLLSAVLAGCSITIEGGGMGRLVIDIFPVPPHITSFTYAGKSNSGLGHTKKGLPIPIENGRAHVDDVVAAGEWHIIITGNNSAWQPVYEYETTVWVVKEGRTVVRVRDKQLGEQTAHGVFFGYGVQERPLQRYIEEYEQFIVPDVLVATGLQPVTELPLIHLYGTRQLWNDESPCRGDGGCYDAALQEIHINAWASGDVNGYALTEAYVHWLADVEGRAVLPYWFITGLARNEAERIVRGDLDWDNRWLQQQWDEIRRSAVLVPALSAYDRADAFTYTAVSHLLQTRGGKYALQEFFQSTRAGIAFEGSFRQAFGLTPAQYQTVYEDAVHTVRFGM